MAGGPVPDSALVVRRCWPSSLAAGAARMRCLCAVVCLALRGLVHRCVDERCPFPGLCSPGRLRSRRPLRPRDRALRRATGGNPWLAAEATMLATPLAPVPSFEASSRSPPTSYTCTLLWVKTLSPLVDGSVVARRYPSWRRRLGFVEVWMVLFCLVGAMWR